MAIELAKAYVQIVPSAEGIQSALKNALGSELPKEGEQQGQKTGQSFAAKFVSVASKAIAAAGLGKILAASLTEGAALEQSIGGVETLFKTSADTVKAYAADAWQSAGLSANAYMQNVSGFAAALTASFSGTEEAVAAAAAESANQAMIDMADNANKMGTSIESVQNAYQGFAKQNYTMLDNLKLGYGGTKTEMERLLADAEKLSGVHYDISNLADVYDAIHVIQTELGITGTTALEAATTLSGSFASVKAAAQNVLGNLALGEDLQPSLDALGESVKTWLVGNLLPMISNILQGLPQIASAALDEIAETVPILQPLVDLLGLLGEHMDAVTVAVAAAAGAMAAYKAQLAISSLITAATKALNGMTVAQWASKAAQDALNLALKANPIGIVVTALGGLATALITAYNTSEDFRNKVNAAFTAVQNAVMPIIEKITSAVTGLKNVLAGAISHVKEFLGIEIDSAASQVLEDEHDMIADKAEVNAMIAANTAAKAREALVSSAVRTTAAAATATAAAKVIESVRDSSTQVLDGVTRTVQTVDELLSDGTRQQQKIITTSSQQIVNGVLKDVKTVETIAADGTKTVATELSDAAAVLLTTSAAVRDAMQALGEEFSYAADSTALQAEKLAVLQAAIVSAEDDVSRLSYLFSLSSQETGAASEQTQYLSAQLDSACSALESAKKKLKEYESQLDKTTAAQNKFKESARNALAALSGVGDSLSQMGELLGSDFIAGLGDMLSDMTGGVNTVLDFAASLVTLTETLTSLKEAVNALKATGGVANLVQGLGSLLGIGGTAAAAGGAAAAGSAAAASAGTAGAAAAGGTAAAAGAATGGGILAAIGGVLSGPVGWALLGAGIIGAIGLGVSAAARKKKSEGSSAAQAVSQAIDYRDIQDAYWYGNERAFAGYDFRAGPYAYRSRAIESPLAKLQSKLDEICSTVTEYLPQALNTQIVLDDGTLVGAITPSINAQLGQLEMLAERGNV